MGSLYILGWAWIWVDRAIHFGIFFASRQMSLHMYKGGFMSQQALTGILQYYMQYIMKA